MPRLDRKDEHIYQSMLQKPRRADFSDIHLIHNCLPDLDYDQVSLETYYMGRTFRSPLFINALTGGTKYSLKINAALAYLAGKYNLPLAVGSQMVALEDKAAEKSFRIVRCINPKGVIWANIGAYASPEMVSRAVRMIKADGVQIHLNAPQELIMREGDNRFSGMIDRINMIVKKVKVPVIVKETGFGISREQAMILLDNNVKAIDIGGKGGTNFIEIESNRSGLKISGDLKSWGIPSAISLIEVADAARGKADLFASGGIYSALDMTKALSLGAQAVGIAGLPVYLLTTKGIAALEDYIKRTERELRLFMIMVGAASITQLQGKPLVICGFVAEWMEKRGLNPSLFAQR